MKKIKILVYLILVLSLLMPILTFALDVPQYWGGAGAYASTSFGNGTISKCSEATTLCFSGNGIYMRLVRYRNGQETTVGTPVLIHTSNFLREEYVAEVEAKDAKYNADQSKDLASVSTSADMVAWAEKYATSKGSCQITTGLKYEFEELTKYPTNKISYAFPSQTKITDNSLPSASSGKLPTYIDTVIMPKYLSTRQKIEATFKHNFTFEEEQNLEEFYVIIDIARRVKGSKVTTNVTPKVTKTELFLSTSSTYNYYCSLTEKTFPSTMGTANSVLTVDDAALAEQTHGHVTTRWEYCEKFSIEDSTEEGVSSCTETTPLKSCSAATEDKSYVTCKNNTATRWKCSKLASNGKESKYVYTSERSCTSACAEDGTCSSGTVTISYDKTTHTCTRSIAQWERKNCVKPAIDYERNLYTKEYTATSKIVLARNYPTTSLVRGLFTPKDEVTQGSGANVISKTRHPVLDKDNKPTGEYEYYVGPTLKEALAGHNGGNKYKLWDATQPATALTVNKIAEGYAVGMAIFWIPDLMHGCKDACPGLTGDALLKCAENYCDNDVGYDDRWNTAKLKDTCLKQCINYTPSNCQNMPNTAETQKYKSALNDVESKKDSADIKCDKETCTPYVQELTGSTPKNAWCHQDDENIPTDQRTFVNVACIEYSNIEFTNLAYKKITPGTGVSYDVQINGSKECYVWFDMPSWQYTYTTFHSKEKVCLEKNSANQCVSATTSRKLLLQALANYNSAKEKGFVGEISPSIASLVDPTEADTNIQWESTDYSLIDSNGQIRTTVTADIKESLSNKAIKEVTIDLIEEDREITKTSSETKNAFSVNLFNRLKLVGGYSSHTYTTSSLTHTEHTIPKYCVSTDGKATVTKADENGNCKQLTVDGRTETVPGQSLYFTSFEALNQSGYDFEVTGTAVIMPSGNDTTYDPKNSNAGNIVCEKEECKPVDPECSIRITEIGTTTISDGVYFGMDGVKAEISNIKMNLGGTGSNADEIITYGILIDPTEDQLKEYTGKEEAKNLKPSKSGVETHHVYCVVKSKKGKTAVNTVPVTFANCSNSVCKITKVSTSGNKTNYKVKVTTAHKKVSIKANYGETETFTVKEYKNIVNSGEYSFTYKNYNSLSLIAIVSNNTGNACCVYNDSNPPIDAPYNCEEWNKNQNHQYKEVEKYCKEHLSEEVHRHKSTDDCVNSCMKCPVITKCDEAGRNELQSYCNSFYGENTNESRQCQNRCYVPYCQIVDDPEYLYRSINNYNPFPNSYDSESPFEQGKREVGANWFGFTDYIKHDDDDTTSVTGVNSNQKPEYVIDLGPGAIEKIRKDTKAKKENDKKESYTEFTNSTDLDKNYSGEYISSFIHDSNMELGGFASLFSNPEEYKK